MNEPNELAILGSITGKVKYIPYIFFLLMKGVKEKERERERWGNTNPAPLPIHNIVLIFNAFDKLVPSNNY